VLGGVVGLMAGMSGLDIVIIGAFLLYAATKEKALAPYHFIRHLAQKKLELATVGVLPGETLVSLDTVRLGDILRLFVPKRFHLVLLVDKDYRYCGMVSEAQMLDAMLKEGLDIPIGRIAGQ
jgi:stage IV sporulation protein FB